VSTPRAVDPQFRELPLERWADLALAHGASLGAEHVLLRVHRLRSRRVALHDTTLDHAIDDLGLGLGVRVVHAGSWGFAATDVLSDAAVRDAVERAVAMARMTAPLARQKVALTPVVGAGWVEHVSSFDIDPTTVGVPEIVSTLQERAAALLTHPSVDHVDADVDAVNEATFVATSDGTFALQERVRIHPTITAHGAYGDAFESLRTLAPPIGRGWEYVTGTGWDWANELAELPDLLAEKLRAPSVEAGRCDLLIDATNLWLTIHESIGHATELDRVLGDEANYAGTSFVTTDSVGSLAYGSPLMTVVADRSAEHGLATVGWDDEGVPGGRWELIRDGVLVDLQTDRATAARHGLAASHGCAYADGYDHLPIQRMPNVGLQPVDGLDQAGLLDALGDGILIVGDGSWSIDMQRYNFQFTGQRFHQVKGGRVVGQLRDVVYQGRTTDFWRSMDAVGDASTVQLMGAFNCGKGQPGQVAPVSHPTPSAVFRQVNVLNAAAELGR
jgi:TldD protein